MNVSPRIKTERVHLRVSPEERRRVERVAAARGLTVTALLLELTEREERQLKMLSYAPTPMF